ncbi:MAG: site-specific DNA-methyltransferase [Nanoarchaeota archaeon]
MESNYLSFLEKENEKYLKLIFNEKELKSFLIDVSKIKETEPSKVVDKYGKGYNFHIKKKYQRENSSNYNKELFNFSYENNNKVKIIWGDCINYLKKMPSESIHLMVTSPPYYNAREYSQWKNINDYLEDMKKIIKEAYRVLDNHRVFVFNVGDISGNDNLYTKSVWGDRRLPLGVYFTKIFEECGFTFVDDFIWDKGEVQSQRHKNGNRPYPLYQYPANCYEHILIFHKHRLDKTKYPCPVCGSLRVSGNTQSDIGIQSWECKNPKCFERSASNRGKRFSLKTNIVQNLENRENNIINHDLVKKWRRDVLRFSPVIKIGRGGVNKLGHTAPFPKDIPEMAVNFFTYKDELVLDPFAGSFTSCIVANRLGRIGVGCEIRKDLFGNAIKDNIRNNEMKFEEVKI